MDVSLEQFRALVEAGIIGKVEYLGGRMVMEGIPMTLSPEQRAAAAEAGIELPPSDVPDAAAVEAALQERNPEELRARTEATVPLDELEETGPTALSGRADHGSSRLGLGDVSASSRTGRSEAADRPAVPLAARRVRVASAPARTMATCTRRATVTAMKAEVLYSDGCPNHEALLPHLRELLASGGAGTNADIELVRVEDVDAAERERFLGSPTVRVDGEDIEPSAADRSDFGLKCRLFATPDGLRGMPAEEWVLDALQRSATRT